MTSHSETLLEAALAYLDDCRTVIPLNGKVPVIPSWKDFQQGKAPTPDEMRQWFKTYGDRITGLGMITGYVHGLAVLDLESDEDPSKYELPPTAISRTGGGGWHYFYDYPYLVDEIKSGPLGAYGIHGDMKADGGYVVVPPSIHPKTGKAYEWIKPLDITEALPQMPKWLADIEERRQAKYEEATDWEAIVGGAKEGNRHDSTVKYVGKLLHHLPSKDWDTFVLPTVLAWNDKANDPPLPDSEVKSIFRGIAQKQHAQGGEGTTYVDKEVSDTTPTRQLLSVSSILNMPESERPEFLVYGLIPEKGITALSGHPGCGKSWILLHLAKCVAAGESFLDNFVTKQGSVLIVDEEQGAWELRRRMEVMGYSEDLPIYFYSLNGFKVDKKEDMEALLQTVKEQNIALVIIDPFAAMHSQDENSAEGAQKVLEAMQRFTKAGATVLFIHHHRKSGMGASSGGAQSLRGSSAYSGRLDSHITVEKKDCTTSEQNLEVEHVKSRRGRNTNKFRVVLAQDPDVIGSPVELRYESIDERTTKKEEARDAITAMLQIQDYTNEEIIQAVREETGVGSRNIGEALRSMVEEGSLSVYKEGKKNKYHLEEVNFVQEDTEPIF